MTALRRFARRAAATTPALAALLLAAAPVAGQEEPLRLGLVLPGAGAAASAANRAAELLGRRVVLLTETAHGADGATLAAARLAEQGAFALIGGFDTESCAALAEAAQRQGVIFFNVGCADDGLRRDRCWSTTFHVAASDAMWRDARAAAEGTAPDAAAALWDADLYRYGAEQLGDRYHDRYATGLDSHAWAGWLAAKALSESALRARTTEAAALARYLTAPRTRFDGHKGRSLSFRPWDHQLRQPVYLVHGEGADGIVELPAGRPAPGQPTEDFLDRLGDGPERGACRQAEPAA